MTKRLITRQKQLSRIAAGCLFFIAIGIPQLPDAMAQPLLRRIAQTNLQPSQNLPQSDTTEQTKRLEAALSTIRIDSDDEGSEINDKIDMFRRIAIAYSEMGAQSRAIETLAQAEQIASENADRVYSYAQTLTRIATYHSAIGETDIAQAKLAEDKLAIPILNNNTQRSN